jgi:hypothetical protein
VASQQARRRRLLAEIRALGGSWPTGRVHKLYRALGFGPSRTTARRDLRYWASRGVLAELGPVNGRTYRLNTTGGQK